ncbi:MAG: DivIVA domain-containing protein [Micrococcales bacterium]|nr:DivIVA domain-containing protein [Micrococcales bacterium]
MALTPEDVVNKRFNPTKFREGYDQDEVDDFLDEVVVELRRLNQDNEELRQRLIAGEARINELQRGGASAPAAQEAAPAEVAAEPVAPAEPEPAAVQPSAEVPAPVAAQPEDHVSDTTSTNNLLQLARRLHEEHVREGIQRRDALIAEGHATAARVVAEAEEQSRAQLAHADEQSRMQLAQADEQSRTQLAQAEEQTRTQLGELESRRSELQTAIDQLSAFEAEYRQKLKTYIQAQLEQLEHTSGVRREAEEAADDHPHVTTGGFAVAPTEQPVHAGDPQSGAGAR